jgi:hypothetical protein
MHPSKSVVTSRQQMPAEWNHPLKRMQRALRICLTKVWPTRNVPLCPPAHAGLVDASSLDIDGMLPGPVLVVFLPQAFETHLEVLVAMDPALVIHPDLSLERNVPYLSWSAPADHGKPPMTLWVTVEHVMKAIDHHSNEGNAPLVQVVMVAGGTVVIGGFSVDAPLQARCDEALCSCKATPSGFSEAEFAKARAKAASYSDRPWLFMSYELRSGNRRLAVTWAPVVNMCPQQR